MKLLKTIGAWAVAVLVLPPAMIGCAQGLMQPAKEKPVEVAEVKKEVEKPKKSFDDQVQYVIIVDNAEQAVKERTNNPDSYKSGHSAIYEDKKGGQTVCGTYRASNAYGGIVAAAYVMRPTFLIVQANSAQLKKHCNGTIVYQKG